MAFKIKRPAELPRRVARSTIRLQRPRPRHVEGWQIRLHLGALPIRLANAEAQSLADLLEQLVAQRMPQGIVDILEVVEIKA